MVHALACLSEGHKGLSGVARMPARAQAALAWCMHLLAYHEATVHASTATMKVKPWCMVLQLLAYLKVMKGRKAFRKGHEGYEAQMQGIDPAATCRGRPLGTLRMCSSLWNA
mmetsp:Transcript_16517/g.45268  ORF Transcript_16517/g.45268 Transcript_16517/m.45268 type:complete len:112 (+) Transcript_16517:1531-1866(+)|eukprot:88074-Pelagomonas_calceolata.AAC.2